LAGSLASYLGHLSHADSFALQNRIWREFAFLEQYFQLDEASQKVCRRQWVTHGFRTVLGQYRCFRGFFANDVLFFQVGRFIEFYGEADQAIADFLGLKRMSINRRGALWGFPVKQARRYLRCLLKAGFPVVCIVETGVYLGASQMRKVVCRVVPVVCQ
jgi:hypothetical protein